MSGANPSGSNPQEEGYFTAFAEFSKTLRTWLVAYGIGGPVVFLTNNDAWNKLSQSGSAGIIGYFFLSGVVLQVLNTFANKLTMWCLYFGEIKSPFKQSRLYRCADRYSEWIWMDVLFDVASIVLFAIGTFKAIAVFTKG